MQGIKKTFTISGSKSTSAQVTVTETYDIATNTSVLSVALAVACSSYYGHTYYLNGTLSAAGKTLQTMNSSSGSHRVTINQLSTYAGVSGSPWSTAAITHNNDGSKTVTVALDIKGYEVNGRGASGFTISGSRELTLTQIPRASTVQATDAAIGASSILSVGRKSAEYSHSLAYSFGSLSGYLAADGTVSNEEIRHTATSVPFCLPEDFYYEIPDAPSAACTVTCTTYLGDTKVGDGQTCTFTVTADPALCAPLVEGQVADVNETTIALTGDALALVRYASRAQCTVTATPRFGAVITEKTVDGTPVEDTVILPMGEQVLFAATDSRGYKTTSTVTTRVVPYVPLTCRAAAKRDDPTSGRVTLTVSGECYNGSFGAVENALTLRCQAGAGEWIDMIPVFQDHTYTATAVLTDLDYTQRHTITVAAADCLASVQAATSVDKGLPVFHWGEQDFTFQVPVYVKGNIELTGGDVLRDGAPAFAPTGYGLGGAKQISMEDIDAITAPGWYYADETANLGGCESGSWYVQVMAGAGGETDCRQEAVCDTGCKLVRCKHAGQWGPWEWQEPPMAVGVEYRTTERYGGKAVYTKIVACGNLPRNATKTVAHGITGATAFVAVRLISGYNGVYFETVNGGDAAMISGANVQIKTTWSAGEYTGHAILQYVKD